MKSLCFTLSGPAACFRQPDVNTQVYFTYNNIHKVALLGLLGAVLGLSGYRNAKLHGQEERVFPEFYEVLSSLLVSVVPNGKNGYFTKKIQYFNNSVGYASKEKGGNLQVREQWLENPSWTIFLAQHNLDDVVWDKLCSNLLQGQCVYIPYLGRNDFPAQIEDVLMVELSPSRQSRIDSLFCTKGISKLWMEADLPGIYLWKRLRSVWYQTIIFMNLGVMFLPMVPSPKRRCPPFSIRTGIDSIASIKLQ